MLFSTFVNENPITVCQSSDLENLHLKENDLIHLGDYSEQVKGYYICSFTRGRLYADYSGLDYSEIDFGVPLGQYNPDNLCVWYYGEKSFGEPVYDKDILKKLAETIAQNIKNGDILEK